MKREHIRTPVFVWRVGTRPTGKIEGLCVFCSSKLDFRRISETGTEADEKLKELYRRDWSALSSRLVGFTNRGYAEERVERFDNTYIPLRGSCIKCGWWVNRLSYSYNTTVNTCMAALREFDINDSELAIPEVKSHLAKKYSDVYSLESRRFEEVIADIYSSLGYEVLLTKQTRDGGADLICLAKRSGELCIVECK
jgi:hypothetical protein